MLKKKFAETICRPYCEFYREGEKEDMYCQGGYICFLLLEKNKLYSENIRLISGRIFDAHRNDEALFQLVCRHCPFIIDGCDFRSKEPPPDAVPCGGYIFLSNALDSGIIIMEDIKDVSGV